ncbi:YdbH domain-containing protein [Nitrincola sp.]|uniref:YdbH domain-containing protein n=1 Tax=Nitrincola sp. TaxID=1926584 RepID=UPI003A8D99E1
MPKKLLLLLLLPLLLLSTLLITAYLLAPTLSRIALEHWITSHGFESVDVSLKHPQAGRIDINQITLTRTDGQRRIRLQANDIQISFSLKALLTTASLKSIHIQRLSAEILIDTTLPERLETLQASVVDLDPTLATRLFDLLPAETAQIAELVLSYQTDEGPLLMGAGELGLNPQQLHTRLSLQRDQQVLGDIRATLGRDLSIHLQINEHHPLYEVGGDFQFIENRWHLNLGHQLHAGALLDWLTRHQVSLPLALQLPMDDQLAFTSRLSLPRLLPLSPSRLLQVLEGDLSLSVRLHPSIDQALAKQISLDIDAQLTLQQSTFNLTLIEGSRVTLHQLSTGDISASRLLLQLIGNTTLSGQLNQPDSWQYGVANWVINGEGLKHQALEHFSLLPLQLQLEGGPLGQSLQGAVSLPMIALQPAGVELPNVSFQGQFTVPTDFSHIDLSGSLSSEQLPVSINTQARLNTNLRGEMNWTLAATPAPALVSALRPFIEAIPSPLMVNTGSFKAAGRLSLNQSDWSLRASLELISADLLYGNNQIEQLQWQSELQIDHQGKLSNTGQIRTGQINIGLPIQLSQLDYELLNTAEQTWLTISPFTASLLEGTIYLPTLSFDPGEPDMIFLISLRDLNLGSILELYAEKGIYGEGLIDGQLPVQITSEGIRIQSGNVGTVQPGVIRYQPDENLDAMADSNMGLRLALDALSNLHYRMLDMQVDYQPNGDLTLRSRLQGNNPEWQQGRPIDLTLTVEDNIPTLLRALQITGRIRDAVDDHFQR